MGQEIHITAVFVYAKDGKIKVLIFNEAAKRHDDLILEGWVHTNTLDPCLFIEYVHNECGELKDLSEI